MGVVTVGLLYLTGWELFTRTTGLLAAALAAVSPFLVWYSRDATSYSWLIMISTLSFYLLLRAVRIGGWGNWALWVLATTTLVYSHYFAVAVLAAQAASFLILRKDSPVKPWLIAQAVLAPLLAGSLLLSSQAGGMVRFAVPDPVAALKGIGTAPHVFVTGYANQVIGSGSVMLRLTTGRLAALALVLGASAVMLMIPACRRRLNARPVAALALYVFLLVAVTVVLQLTREGLVTGRYYAWAAPPFFLLTAALLSALGRRAALLACAALLLGMSYFSALELKRLRNDDWRGMMAVVGELRQDGDRFLCFPLHHCQVAANLYLIPSPAAAGGWVGSEAGSVLFSPEGWRWSGYSTSGSELVSEHGPESLGEQLAQELAGTERVWIFSGTGELGNYPKADIVTGALPSGWRLAGEWRKPPLVLELYEYQPPSAGG